MGGGVVVCWVGGDVGGGGVGGDCTYIHPPMNNYEKIFHSRNTHPWAFGHDRLAFGCDGWHYLCVPNLFLLKKFRKSSGLKGFDGG